MNELLKNSFEGIVVFFVVLVVAHKDRCCKVFVELAVEQDGVVVVWKRIVATGVPLST